MVDMPWRRQFVDPRTRFLNDEDFEDVLRRFPHVPGDPSRGCPTCRGKKSFLWRGEKQECDCELQVVLHMLYLSAGIGPLYQRLDWDDYEGDTKARDFVFGYLRRHAAFFSAGFGLILHGPYGTGKTMLVNLAAKDLLRLGYGVYATTFPAMVDMFTKGWGDNAEKERFERKIIDSDFLVLDDIGKEFRSKTNLAESTFDHILRQRAVNLRPTVLTTNMSEDELAYGYGAAIFSLLRERSDSHEMTGEDWRSEAHERSLSEIGRGEVRPIV
jgi:DNA replication protein DnaC